MSAKKFWMNKEDKALWMDMMQRSGPNMHFSFMRKLEMEQGWVGEQELGLHEFEKIGATWSKSGMV